MPGWVDIKSARPTISGEYNIKAIGLFKDYKKCYYDAVMRSFCHVGFHVHSFTL